MDNEHNITYHDQEILVYGDYIPAEIGEWTNPAGEPGIADSPAEFYITKITNLEHVEITDVYNADDFSNISEIILRGYE
jgi:hypothetical protein